MFASIAEQDGGVAAIDHLAAAQRSKQLMLIRTIVGLARVTGHPHAPAVEAAYRTLTELQRRAPEAVATVLFYPAVRAWAQRTALRLDRTGGAGGADGGTPGDGAPGGPRRTPGPGGDPRGPVGAATGDTGAGDAAPQRLAAVAAAAAVRGAATAMAAGQASARTIELPDSGPVVSLPSLGVALPPGRAGSRRGGSGGGGSKGDTVTVRVGRDGADVRAGGGRVRIPGEPGTDAGGWIGIPPLAAEAGGRRIELFFDDLDPYRFPGMTTADGLRERDLGPWRDRLTDGWRLLVRHHPGVAAEVEAAITVLTPLSGRSGVGLSATSREAFGCAAMSLPADGRAMAVTLTHELQHAKLAALMDLFRLTTETPGRRFYAPWRPDPRPLSGLLHGAYAHTGVAAFWNRQRGCEDDPAAALSAHTEFALWREASTEVARFLMGSGLLTAPGRTLVAGMLRTLDRLAAEPVPGRALARARERLDRHRLRHRSRTSV
jgi:uncharacterized protein